MQPDVKVDVNTALEVSQSMALKAIAAKDVKRSEPLIGLLLESVDARLHPHKGSGGTTRGVRGRV